jgi:hypothetical protein
VLARAVPICLLALVLAAAPARAALDGPTPTPPAKKPPPTAPGAEGELLVVPGKSARVGRGPLLRVAVEVEGGLRVDRAAFAARVVGILADRRSWGRSVRRVPARNADVRVALVRPTTADQLCAPLQTNGIFSCAQGGRAVLNARRWWTGAHAYHGRLSAYRVYMVNHEVGHLLGRDHAPCPAAGAKAPVMMQQTKRVAPCRANPWPLPAERG